MPVKEREEVKILCIIGNTQRVDTQPDHQTINNLPDADVHLLQQPDRHEITNQLWEQGWDVLFFAGHSSSQNGQGRIYLNNAGENLTIPELQAGLKRAIKKGLQLAIFNSCDGIGLAAALAELNIPAVVVMREPIPDIVAHHFLRSFLVPLAQGESLHMALRHACDRLQEEETTIPCASWLPTLYHNASSPPPTWQRLRTGGRISGRVPPFTADIPSPTIPIPQPRSVLPLRKRIVAIVLVSLLCTILSMLIRTPEFVQFAEMPFYDLMMRATASQTEVDDRFLIITIGRDDTNWQDEEQIACRRTTSLQDEVFVKLLKVLYAGQPAVVAQSLERLFEPCDNTREELAALLKMTRHNLPMLIDSCYVSSAKPEKSWPPPPLLRTQQQQVGFIDIFEDLDRRTRRQAVSAGLVPNSKCQAKEAFSTLVAARYVQQIQPTDFEQLRNRWSHVNSTKHLDQIYRGDQLGGQQILTKYISTHGDPTKLFPHISLQKVLSPEFDRRELQNKIVLIGRARLGEIDYDYPPAATPLGDLPNTFLQAQMIRQMVDILLERDSSIRIPSSGWQWLWVYLWSLLGACVASSQNRLLSFVGFTGTVIVISTIVYVSFLYSFWLFLVVPLLGYTLSFGSASTLFKQKF